MSVSAISAFRGFTKILTTTFSEAQKLRKSEKAAGGASSRILQSHATQWANEMLRILKVKVEVTGSPDPGVPAIYVGNHISYIDIPLLMSVAPVSFVAKSQIRSWPIFGDACDSAGVLWVERDSTDSRRAAALTIGRCIRERKQSVVIFPSGTTTVDESKPWRWGVFQIAQMHKVPVVPFRLTYRPLRKAAFIGDDLFPTHLWRLLREKEVLASIDFHAPVQIENAAEECQRWWKWAQEKVESR